MILIIFVFLLYPPLGELPAMLLGFCFRFICERIKATRSFFWKAFLQKMGDIYNDLANFVSDWFSWFPSGDLSGGRMLLSSILTLSLIRFLSMPITAMYH